MTEETHNHAIQILIERVLELHGGGRTAQEIASAILTTDPETAMFRAGMLVEVIIACARTHGDGHHDHDSPC